MVSDEHGAPLLEGSKPLARNALLRRKTRTLASAGTNKRVDEESMHAGPTQQSALPTRAKNAIPDAAAAHYSPSVSDVSRLSSVDPHLPPGYTKFIPPKEGKEDNDDEGSGNDAGTPNTWDLPSPAWSATQQSSPAGSPCPMLLPPPVDKFGKGKSSTSSAPLPPPSGVDALECSTKSMSSGVRINVFNPSADEKRKAKKRIPTAKRLKQRRGTEPQVQLRPVPSYSRVRSGVTARGRAHTQLPKKHFVDEEDDPVDLALERIMALNAGRAMGSSASLSRTASGLQAYEQWEKQDRRRRTIAQEQEEGVLEDVLSVVSEGSDHGHDHAHDHGPDHGHHRAGSSSPDVEHEPPGSPDHDLDPDHDVSPPTAPASPTSGSHLSGRARLEEEGPRDHGFYGELGDTAAAAAPSTVSSVASHPAAPTSAETASVGSPVSPAIPEPEGGHEEEKGVESPDVEPQAMVPHVVGAAAQAPPVPAPLAWSAEAFLDGVAQPGGVLELGWRVEPGGEASGRPTARVAAVEWFKLPIEKSAPTDRVPIACLRDIPEIPLTTEHLRHRVGCTVTLMLVLSDGAEVACAPAAVVSEVVERPPQMQSTPRTRVKSMVQGGLCLGCTLTLPSFAARFTEPPRWFIEAPDADAQQGPVAGTSLHLTEAHVGCTVHVCFTLEGGSPLFCTAGVVAEDHRPVPARRVSVAPSYASDCSSIDVMDTFRGARDGHEHRRIAYPPLVRVPSLMARMPSVHATQHKIRKKLEKRIEQEDVAKGKPQAPGNGRPARTPGGRPPSSAKRNSNADGGCNCSVM